MRAAVALAAAALGIVSSAQAADFGIISFAGSTPIISLAGPIAPGDDVKFNDFAQALRYPAIVRLSSYGGNTMAALAIGREIARLGYSTYVSSDEICASACGLIWLAGKTKLSSGSARIGLHATYLKQNGVNVAIPGGNALVGKYLGELGFRDEFVVYATSAEPDEMSWLNRGVTNNFGLNWEQRDQDVATLVTIDAVKTDPTAPASAVLPTPANPAPLSEPKRVPTETIRPDGSTVDPNATAYTKAANEQEQRDDAEKQRFIDRALKAADPPIDIGLHPARKAQPNPSKVVERPRTLQDGFPEFSSGTEPTPTPKPTHKPPSYRTSFPAVGTAAPAE